VLFATGPILQNGTMLSDRDGSNPSRLHYSSTPETISDSRRKVGRGELLRGSPGRGQIFEVRPADVMTRIHA